MYKICIVVYINNSIIYSIADNEGMKSPIDDANDLLYDKLLYQPPHVELRPPPPIIVRPLSDIDIYNAVIYEEDGNLYMTALKISKSLKGGTIMSGGGQSSTWGCW